MTNGVIGLRRGIRIAQTEWMRSRRQFGRSLVVRAAIAILILSSPVIAAVIAYSFGTAYRSGAITLPVATLRTLITTTFLMLVIGFVQQTSRLLKRLNTDHLLTTVPTHAVIIGVVLAACGRVAARLLLTASGIAIGFSVGTRSPVGIATIIIAAVCFLSLAALIGVAFSFAGDFLTTRSPRFQRYKSVCIVVVFILASVSMALAIAGLVSIDLVAGWLAAVPTAWFVDLALVGVPRAPSGFFQSVGALGLFSAGVPVLVTVTTALAERVWVMESVSATTHRRSRSLVGSGVVERLIPGGLSRPVLTVMRKRWVQERRVPVAVLMLSNLFFLLPIVYLPMLFTEQILLVSPLSLAAVLGAATGLCFGTSPIGTEYSSFPMTLTTISGRHFVRGEILAGVIIGAPITVVATLLLALGSPMGILEAIAVGIAGGMLSVCSMALAIAIGMEVSYVDLLPAPLPLSSATIRAEIGWAGFVRNAILLGILALVCLPGFAGYLVVFLQPIGVPATISQPLIRIAALLLMSVLAAAVSGIAYQRAVQAFDQYTI